MKIKYEQIMNDGGVVVLNHGLKGKVSNIDNSQCMKHLNK